METVLYYFPEQPASPRNPVIYQKLATLHIRLHQFNEAIVVLQKALDISPVDIESSVLLAYCYNYTNQPQKAFNTLDITLNICSQSPQQDNALKQMLRGFVFTKTAIHNDFAEN